MAYIYSPEKKGEVGGVHTRQSGRFLGSEPDSPITSTATPRLLTYTPKDVIDTRISIPAQHALVRLSKDPSTSADALGLLEAVKSRQMAGIYCANWEKSAKRALRFGKSWWTIIPQDEDAILMLDPDSPLGGQPLIAFRRELSADCGDKQFAGSPSRLDAALLKVWESYKAWQAGRRPDGATQCAISPTGNGVIAADTQPPLKALSNVMPQLACYLRVSTRPPRVIPRLTPPCSVGPCLTHFIGPFEFSGPSIMIPRSMNPGFINSKTDSLVQRPELQTALEQLLDSKYKAEKPRIAVALVDLTGDKLYRPEFAGWRESAQMFGASLPKIAVLYATFQLKNDLSLMASLNPGGPITTRVGLISEARKRWQQAGLELRFQPKVEEMFTFEETASSPVFVDLSAELRDLICCTFESHNCNRTTSILIDKVGYPFISSALWQSGLFHETRGGLWLEANYGLTRDCTDSVCLHRQPPCTSASGKCPDVQTACNNLFARTPLTSRPVFMPAGIASVRPLNVTALSAAAYFTLLAQSRLVSKLNSNEIMEALRFSCSYFAKSQRAASDEDCKREGFPNKASSFDIYPRAPAKCGASPDASNPLLRVMHDAILFNRTVNGREFRYVAVLLTENLPLRNPTCFFRNGFLVDLDNIIQSRNPDPATIRAETRRRGAIR